MNDFFGNSPRSIDLRNALLDVFAYDITILPKRSSIRLTENPNDKVKAVSPVDKS